MRTWLLLAPLALLPGAWKARAGTAASVQEPAAAPDKKLADLIARFNKQQNDVYDAYSKADEAGASDADKEKIWATRPGKEYVPEFRAIAEEAKGTDTAPAAWMWVLKLNPSDGAEVKRVVELLLEEHMQSSALEELTGYVRDPDPLRAMVAESPHERVRAAALFALGRMMLTRKSDSDKAEGRDCMEAVIAEYGEVSMGNRTYAKMAEGHLFELDNLQIGKAPPDFEVVDENGVKWKLSDYRGKVVVVDFWGFW